MSRASASGLGGFASTGTIVDYLQPEVNRPDLYIREGMVDYPNGRVSSRKEKLGQSLVVIVISAFLFIGIFSWANLLKVYYDAIFVNDVIMPEFYASLYYALTVTGIAIILCTVFIYFLLAE